MMPPAELLARLDEVNPARRGEVATLEECHRCAAWILAGWDGPFSYRLDPRALTLEEELEALLAGRLTYELRWPAPLKALQRDQWRVVKAPAQLREFVVPAHDCGWMLGGAIPWGILYPPPLEDAEGAGPRF